MAQPPEDDTRPLFGMLREDVPESLVDDLLRLQRTRGLFQRYSQHEWDALRESHGQLLRYIGATSFELAPEDPVLRERVAASLLGLSMLLDEASIELISSRLVTAHQAGEDLSAVADIFSAGSGDEVRRPAA